MQMSPNVARALTLSGIIARRNGDAFGARKVFAPIAAAGPADASAFLGPTHAYRAFRDHIAALATVKSALEREPRNLRAFMLKAEQRDSTVDAGTVVVLPGSAQISRHRRRTYPLICGWRFFHPTVDFGWATTRVNGSMARSACSTTPLSMTDVT